MILTKNALLTVGVWKTFFNWNAVFDLQWPILTHATHQPVNQYYGNIKNYHDPNYPLQKSPPLPTVQEIGN